MSLPGHVPSKEADTADVAPELYFNKRTYKTFPVACPATDKTEGLDLSANSVASPSVPVYRALVCIPADLLPGAYQLKAAGCERQIQVMPGGFGVQRLRLPSDKDNFLASPGEEEAVNKAKETVTAERFWSGKFSQPCKARVSAQFGLRRIVNGRLLSDYFHSGLDYAGILGASVRAAQSGRVLMAHSGWRLHGNTICIDHGQGVVSFYIHLKDILVKPGQTVRAGDLIGRVGRSGRANGPHLHFSIYVNADAANPLDWFGRVF